MKRAMLLIGGLFWFLFAAGFAVFLVQYVRQGAGAQFSLTPVSSGSVLVGLIHVVGFSTAVLLCFAVGVGLCVRGIVREEDNNEKVGAVADPDFSTRLEATNTKP